MENRKALFIASFMTLIAAGVGFAIRGAILGAWSAEYGFTFTELGTITGGGLVGFGLIIIVSSLFVDKIGYKPLMMLAFVLHILSAFITFAASSVHAAYGKDATYYCLYIGMFMFAVANGLCEAVINPLTATLYPKQKTHYLNILHAGWPGGLILGGLMAYLFCGANPIVKNVSWEISMALFLIPTVIYGFLVMKEKFPISEARAAGVKFGTMLKEFAAPLFLFLLLLHAMVGYVELGTDSWITAIFKGFLGNNAALLLVYTSVIMFVLRFFAGPIVEKINPLGLLLLSAVLGCVGLYLLGSFEAGIAIFLAATIYGIGKTFFWPTMLGVVGERFPKGGAVTMGMIGGVGMLSAGLLGGPGIGFKQDYYASQNLQQNAPETYERYKAADKNRFLMFEANGLDGQKVAILGDGGADLNKAIEQLTVDKKSLDDSANKGLKETNAWWEDAKAHAETDKKPIGAATIYGGQMALKWTSLVPFMMGIGFLILVLYFRAKGGYQQEVLHGEAPEGEHYTGGVEGPMEG